MIESTLQLRQWALSHELPMTMTEEALDNLSIRKLYTIPIDYDEYPRTDAIVLTGPVQLRWVAQLVLSPVRYVLHIDGKHKLHHGKWMMVSIGVHDLAQGRKKTTVHSYRPLVYMFVKQEESTESVQLLCDALDWLALTYYGSRLTPGVVVMDHSDGFRSGVLRTWPETGPYRIVSLTYLPYRVISYHGSRPCRITVHVTCVSDLYYAESFTCCMYHRYQHLLATPQAQGCPGRVPLYK